MTNVVQEEVFTEEQKKFILTYLNRGTSGPIGYYDPDKAWTATGPAEPAKSMDEWFDNLSRPFVDSINDKMRVISVENYVTSGYSKMSELERLAFVRGRLTASGNPVLSEIMNSDDIKSATNVNTLLARISTKLESLPDVSWLSVGNTAKNLLNEETLLAQAFKNFPATPEPTPEPEPVVEKPNWFETSSKDHQERVEQWMEHLGMKDNAQALIDKYGLPVAYEVVQTAMQGPGDMTKATDGKFRNSKNTIQYFLDNDVTAEKLETIPDLDAETIKASLDSVKKPEPVVRPEPVQAVSIDLPTNAVSMPSAPVLSQLDTQKAHYAALMGKNLKIDGIDAADIKAASEAALRATLPNKSDTLDEWSAGFRYNLSKALGLQETAKNTKHYQDRANVLIAASKDAIEAATSGEPSAELAEQVAAYTSIVNRHNLKGDLAGMSGTETLNPETYFKDRQVQKQLLARAEKRAEREGRKAERKANRQESITAIKDWAKSLVD